MERGCVCDICAHYYIIAVCVCGGLGGAGVHRALREGQEEEEENQEEEEEEEEVVVVVV